MVRFIKQFFRHSVIGGIAFLIDYGLLFWFTEIVGIYYLVSAIISFTISMIFNYGFSMRYVFTRRDDISRRHEFVLFVILSVIGLIANTVLLWAIVKYTALHYMAAKLVATAIVTLYNFWSRKRYLEKRKKEIREKRALKKLKEYKKMGPE
ncbi:MAG: GtrA family protein [Lachnospiraceae bacterium]|nr:GtrA family protein [Lachnospiraceae bacterium]